MIITGDIHGDTALLLDRLKTAEIPQSHLVCLLGDVGVNFFGGERDRDKKLALLQSGRTYFCIHGNHEKRPEGIETYKERIWNGGKVYIEDEFPNIIFAKDGEVFDIGGVKVLTIGGAYSVDKWTRLRYGYPWFKDEQISPKRRREILSLIKRNKPSVDLVLTHTCPLQWQPKELFLPHVNQSSVDDSTERWLSEIEKHVEYRLWLFGHFHDDKIINEKARLVFERLILWEEKNPA